MPTVSCLPTCVEPGGPRKYEPITVGDYYSMKKSQQRMARAKALEAAYQKLTSRVALRGRLCTPAQSLNIVATT